MDPIIETLQNFKVSNQNLSFLVGAGLSAESGIPTFRDKDGFWTDGSENYTPQEMATWKMFSQDRKTVWAWYLYRIGVCSKAKPNPGHHAMAKIQNLYSDRVSCISQNVDGLHAQTSIDQSKVYCIHGDLRYMRCSEECHPTLYPIPKQLTKREKDKTLSPSDIELLNCKQCGSISRPHVLWFDECYNEEHYKMDSALKAAYESDILITIGTTGTTNLPNQIIEMVLRNNGTVIDINPNPHGFTEFLTSHDKGYWLKGKSGEIVPALYDILK